MLFSTLQLDSSLNSCAATIDLTLSLKSAQMTSLIVIIVGICLFIYLGYLERKNQPVLETTETAPKTKNVNNFI